MLVMRVALYYGATVWCHSDLRAALWLQPHAEQV